MTVRNSKASSPVRKLRLPLKQDADFKAAVDEFLKGLRIEQHLIRLRKERELTQSQLAEMIGVTQPLIAKMESGQLTNIELKTLARTVMALNGRLSIQIESDSTPAGSSQMAKAHA